MRFIQIDAEKALLRQYQKWIHLDESFQPSDFLPIPYIEKWLLLDASSGYPQAKTVFISFSQNYFDESLWTKRFMCLVWCKKFNSFLLVSFKIFQVNVYSLPGGLAKRSFLMPTHLGFSYLYICKCLCTTLSSISIFLWSALNKYTVN